MDVQLIKIVVGAVLAILAFAQGFGFIDVPTKINPTEADIKRQRSLSKLGGIACLMMTAAFVIDYMS
jgi:hypothetical protein